MRNFSRSRSISNSLRSREERLDRLQRPGHQVLTDLADVRVLDDHVAADRDDRPVRLELGLDVRLRVVGVEDDERLASAGTTAHLVEDVRVGRRASSEIRDPRVPGVVVPQRLDVDRDHLAAPDEVADRRQVERASPAVRARLDDDVGPRLEDDLLVDPEVERVLQRLRAEPVRPRPRVRLVEHVVSTRNGGPVEPLVHAVAHAGHRPSQVVLHGWPILGWAREAEDLEVAIRDVGDRRRRDCRAPLLELGHEPVEHGRKLLVLAEREPALADQLGVPAAREERRGKAAGERLQQRVRAGVVAARGDVDVVRAQELGDRRGVDRPDRPDPLERDRALADEGQLVAIPVEVAVEPGEGLGALADVRRPARSRSAAPCGRPAARARPAGGRSRDPRRSR